MLTYEQILQIREAFNENRNVIELFRDKYPDHPLDEAILYSYDLQAGCYSDAIVRDERFRWAKRETANQVAEAVTQVDATSVCEAGVGEASVLSALMDIAKGKDRDWYGFDLSLSRLLFAADAVGHKPGNPQLVAGELGCIPAADGAFDMVFTCHAVEPNGGREKEILAELLRVAARYLLLIEPSYELGGERTRRRIENAGYCRDLPEILSGLGCEIVVCRPFGADYNPDNQAAFILARKCPPSVGSLIKPPWVSPISKMPLHGGDSFWFCPNDGYLFPEFHGIPILLKERAILASKADSFMNFKLTPTTR